MKTGVINCKAFFDAGMRIDPDVHLSEGSVIRNELNHLPYQLSTVGENAADVFYGNIFSRIFVQDPEHGMPYLAASDTVLANLDTGRFLSKKQSAQLNYLILKKDWILVTCSGTLGNVTYTNKTFENHIATHDLIRIIPNSNKVNKGTLYAFLASNFGYYQITQSQFGGVVKHINTDQTKSIIVPVFPADFQQEVDDMIQESARLREQATDELRQAQQILKEKASLPDLTPEDYDFYGSTIQNRTVSTFSLNKKDISLMTINAFNYSQRVRNLESKITCNCCSIGDVILGGTFFSTGSFPRVEVKKKHGIMLINQSDIFDAIIEGKYISRRGVKTDSLVEYGEVMIAGVGTLGENETFCRTIFANEDLVGQLVSGEFIRMKTNGKVPAGYLYAWLSSDYGFRLIRSTQAGTKLCRPIQKLLLQKPIPIIDNDSMNEIDKIVKTAHTKRHQANKLELAAIANVEQEIEKWNK